MKKVYIFLYVFLLLALPLAFAAQPPYDPHLWFKLDDNTNAEYGENLFNLGGVTYDDAVHGRGATGFAAGKQLYNDTWTAPTQDRGTTIMFNMYSGTWAVYGVALEIADGTSNDYIRFYRGPAALRVRLKDVASEIDTDTAITANNWYNIAVVFNGTVQKYYINGTPTTSTLQTRDMSDVCTGANCNITIGNSDDSSGPFFATAVIDDVYVFNYSLNQDEIQTIFADMYSGSPPSGEPSAIEVIITKPDMDYGFNESILQGIDYGIWINVSRNQTNASCNITDARWSIDSNTSTFYYFINNSYLANNKYSMTAICNDSDMLINGTDYVNFTIDTILPSYDPDIMLISNNTFVVNGTLETQINFTDDLEIYSINVSFSNGTIIYNQLNIGQDNYQLNVSYGVNDNILDYLNVRVCDAHTKKNIDTIDRIDIVNNGLKYVIQDNPLWIQDSWVYIYPKDSFSYTTPKTDRLYDRYTFTFNKKSSASSTETFVVESSHYIDITKLQKYKGHLVVPALNRWIDFENSNAKINNIKRISDTKVEITISGLKGASFDFSSIGELNCVEQQLYYGNVNPIQRYSNHVIVGDTTTFFLNITEPEIATTITASLFYNNTLYSISGFANFSKSITVPSVVQGNDTNITFNWILDVDGLTYNITKLQQNVSMIHIDNCSSYTTESLRILFVNLSSGLQTNVEAILIAEGDYDYTSTIVDVKNMSLCIFPSTNVFEEGIAIQYGTGAYNYYSNTFSLTDSLQTITLYLQDEATSTTTFTVKDKNTLLFLKDAYITMYRQVDGAWTVMESHYTDLTGRAQFNYEEYVYYKFTITKSGYESYIFYLNPVLFTSYDILLNPSTTIDDYQDYEKVSLILSPTVFYNNMNNNFTMLISCPYNELTSYGYTLTYPGGTTTRTGNNSLGGDLNTTFAVSNAGINDYVRIDYYYETSSYGRRDFSTQYSIVLGAGNFTMIANRDKTYGLGIFERTFISVFIVLLVVGIASLIGQPLAGMALGVILYGYFVYIGFLSIWMVALPLFIGLMILFFKPEG